MQKVLNILSFPIVNIFPKRKSKTVRQKTSVNFFNPLGLFLLVLNGYLLLSYIVGSNSYALKGYELKRQQTKILELTEANKKINLKVAELSSMGQIQKNLEGAKFVFAGNPKFLELSQFSLK